MTMHFYWLPVEKLAWKYAKRLCVTWSLIVTLICRTMPASQMTAMKRSTN
jgi:hypothetical protein